MNAATWNKVKVGKAAEICKQFSLREEARPLLRDGLSPREFLDVLLAGQQLVSAIDFVAHALPARECIWWGCLCLEHARGEKWSAEEKAACKTAVEWVLDPTDEHRQAARGRGETLGLGTPAGALALAASWTGGSLNPPNLPPAPPAPSLPAKGVAAAVALASTQAAPLKIPDTQRRFVELGIAVAEGRITWPDLKKKT
jgi:hypothetical protein